MTGQPDSDPFTLDARARRVASWGAPPDGAISLGDRIIGEFERVNGELPEPNADASTITVPESRMDKDLVSVLAKAAQVVVDDNSRAALSIGKSYPDLLSARSGHLNNVCDAVVRPTSIDAVRSIIDICAENELTLIPVGGGSSVVGGIEPLPRLNDRPIVSLDMTALSATVDVDSVSRVGTFQAGISGPELEHAVGEFGLTLGHVPQSFALSTLGGWIATRSAGQQSLAYGKIESMVGALEIITPAGILTVDHVPAHASGPDAIQLALGSEGLFGVITRATVRLSPRPERVRFATYVCSEFAVATAAARAIVQGGLRPATVRVSDTQETQFSLGSALPSIVPRSLAGKVARRTGLGEGAMMIVIIPGDHKQALDTEQSVQSIMRSFGAKSLGPTPARHWYHGRFNQPFVRDLLMDRGLIVDTLETAVSWIHVADVHRDVRIALERTLGEDQSIVGCHLSHLYPDGASLYFTFIARSDENEHLNKWRRAKQAVAEVLVRHKAAASHQHAIGTMHKGMYHELMNQLGRESFLAVKQRLDPTGILNPGKVFADSVVDVQSINDPDAGTISSRLPTAQLPPAP